MNAKDNGTIPASPCPLNIDLSGNVITCDFTGLTKRELFAAMAMQGFCALPQVGDVSSDKTIAEMAVEHADALIAELVK